jgi:hypothetical protein
MDWLHNFGKAMEGQGLFLACWCFFDWFQPAALLWPLVTSYNATPFMIHMVHAKALGAPIATIIFL